MNEIEDHRAAGNAPATDLFSIDAAPADRSKAFNGLFFNLREDWAGPFWLMLVLAGGIASFGLSENSAATVIGAMIVAPLGQPIVALGGAIALRWPVQSARLFGLVALGAVSVLALGYIAGLFLPSAVPNDQILARTAPDIRDLGIAIFSGAAGAYGYRRGEYSSVLAGVAIAVALVPPLCVSGLMLEDGRPILAFGGLLLFLTNFAGIVLAAIFVFSLGGALQNAERRGWFMTAILATLVLNALLLWPLSRNYDRAAGGPSSVTRAYAMVKPELRGPFAGSVIEHLSIDGAQLGLTLSPLPTDPELQKRFVGDVQEATGLQVVLIDGKAKQ